MSLSQEINKIWDPKDYSENSSLQLLQAKELISRCNFIPSNSILDVGCGDGKITAMLSKSVPDGLVIGIDASPQMVQFSNNTFPKHLYPNLFFRHDFAENFHLDQKFDFIFSFFLFAMGERH